MNLNQLPLDINDETKTVLSADFTTDVSQAYVLPSVDDQDITFENFDDKTKKVKSRIQPASATPAVLKTSAGVLKPRHFLGR